MPQATPSARMIGRIQRLCCFGPGGLSFIPDVLRELGAVLPASVAPHFVHQGNGLTITGVYSEDSTVVDYTKLYAREFEEKLEKKVVVPDSDLLQNGRHRRPVGEWFDNRGKVRQSEWRRSELFNEVFRPIGADRMMLASVARQGAMLGTIAISRSVADPAFTKRDTRLLEAVEPFVAHALAAARKPAGPYVESDQQALLMVDAAGAVQHASREGRTLLTLASFAMNVPLATTRAGDGLPDEVVRLCRRVAVFSEANPLPTPPVWRHKNDWGEFVFRVFRMEQLSALPSPRLLGVSVERREPLRLKLLRRLGELPLSARETELCLALLDGDSRGAIAERLGIGETTAITHTRNLYAKLDVHNRTELVEKLHAM